MVSLCKGKIKEINKETEELVATFKGHSKEVESIAFSSDEKILASVSKDGETPEGYFSGSINVERILYGIYIWREKFENFTLFKNVVL